MHKTFTVVALALSTTGLIAAPTLGQVDSKIRKEVE